VVHKNVPLLFYEELYAARANFNNFWRAFWHQKKLRKWLQF